MFAHIQWPSKYFSGSLKWVGYNAYEQFLQAAGDHGEYFNFHTLVIF